MLNLVQVGDRYLHCNFLSRCVFQRLFFVKLSLIKIENKGIF